MTRTHEKYLKLAGLIGEPGLPGLKGLPGDSGLCTYIEHTTTKTSTSTHALFSVLDGTPGLLGEVGYGTLKSLDDYDALFDHVLL